MIRSMLLGSCLGWSCTVMAGEPKPSDFAYQHLLTPQAGGAIYVLAVPPTVYEFSSDDRFGDLRIFNNQSQAVLHTIKNDTPSLLPIAHSWRVVAPQPKDNENSRVFDYDIGGRFPVDTVVIDFLDNNILTNVSLSSRQDSLDTWRVRYQGPVYNLRSDGLSLLSEPIALPIHNHRYWRVTVNTHNALTTGAAPRLRVAWQAEELIFVAEGDAPFRLCFGSTAVRQPPFSATTVTSLLTDPATQGVIRVLTEIGPLVRLNHELKQPRVQLEWNRICLWAVLAACAATLVFVGLKLAQEILPAR